MAKDFAKKFYNSKQWLNCRNSYKLSKFGLCERCKSPNASDVHHKIKLNEFNINNPDIALNQNNLSLLCKDCHNQEHMSKYSPLQQGLSFDANGDLVCHTPPGANVKSL